MSLMSEDMQKRFDTFLEQAWWGPVGLYIDSCPAVQLSQLAAEEGESAAKAGAADWHRVR
jgi:hypothetical protein